VPLTEKQNMKNLKVYWMRGKGRDIPSLKNFGDWLSKDVFEYISGRRVIWESAKKAEYFGIGSISIRVNKLPLFRFTPLKIWGSGLSNGNILEKHRCIRLLSCRGELTKDAFCSITSIPHNLSMGDPGLFVSEIWKANKNKKKVAVILNEGELDFAKQIPSDLDFISPLGEPKDVVKLISSYDFIISSSLHGLIVADAYSIPSRMLKIRLNKFKFDDYYSIYPSREILPPLTIEELNDLNVDKIETYFNHNGIELERIKQCLRVSLVNSLD